MKYWIYVLILINLGLPGITSHAQYLHFNKLNHRVYANYKVGENITFKLKGTDERFNGQILGITDSTIVFEYYEFSPDEIAAIYIDEKIMSHYMFKFKWYRILIFTGIGYPMLETVNSGKTDSETIRQGLLMIGAGIFIRLIMRDQLPIDERHTLTIIHSGDPPDLVPDPIIR
jgi:hypothetical protein